jgi:hypothetical protein
VPSAGKMMLTLFRDIHRPILKHYRNPGQTASSTWYCATLEEELKPAIRGKNEGMPSKVVDFHHDNPRPRTAAATFKMILKL